MGKVIFSLSISCIVLSLLVRTRCNFNCFFVLLRTSSQEIKPSFFTLTSFGAPFCSWFGSFEAHSPMAEGQLQDLKLRIELCQPAGFTRYKSHVQRHSARWPSGPNQTCVFSGCPCVNQVGSREMSRECLPGGWWGCRPVTLVIVASGGEPATVGDVPANLTRNPDLLEQLNRGILCGPNKYLEYSPQKSDFVIEDSKSSVAVLKNALSVLAWEGLDYIAKWPKYCRFFIKQTKLRAWMCDLTLVVGQKGEIHRL